MIKETVMTSTSMKISKRTLDILKNYASVNSNLLVKPGNTISTISPVKNILSEVEVDETFEVEFGIWDLNKFLGTISLFNDPEFEFGDKSVTISGSNSSSVVYRYCEPKLLTVPTKKVQMPKVAVSFELTQKAFAELLKAAAVLQLPDIGVRYNIDDCKEGKIEMFATDKSDPSSNFYSFPVGDHDGDESFKMYFKTEDLKLFPGDYEVELCKQIVSKFSHKDMDLCYWIALQADSIYKD